MKISNQLKATMSPLSHAGWLLWLYILKAGFRKFRNPQKILNFPQRVFLRMQKQSIWVPEDCKFCNVLEMKVTKCWKVLHKSPNSLINMFLVSDILTFCFQKMHILDFFWFKHFSTDFLRLKSRIRRPFCF